MRLNLGVDIGVQIQKQFERLSMPSGCDRGRLQHRRAGKTKRRRPTLRLDRLLYAYTLSVVSYTGDRLLQFILDLSTPDLGSAARRSAVARIQSVSEGCCEATCWDSRNVGRAGASSAIHLYSVSQKTPPPPLGHVTMNCD